jgi:hypothetical protein
MRRSFVATSEFFPFHLRARMVRENCDIFYLVRTPSNDRIYRSRWVPILRYVKIYRQIFYHCRQHQPPMLILHDSFHHPITAGKGDSD